MRYKVRLCNNRAFTTCRHYNPGSNSMPWRTIRPKNWLIKFYFILFPVSPTLFLLLFFLVRPSSLLLQHFFRFTSFSSVHFCVLLLRWGWWLIVGLRVRVFRYGGISRSALQQAPTYVMKRARKGEETWMGMVLIKCRIDWSTIKWYISICY